MQAKSFVSFQLNEQLFAIDILFVREINRYLELTPVPLAPEYVKGLVNLRGQIVTVLDLKKRLGIKNHDNVKNSHNIVLKTEAELSNLTTDEDLAEEMSDKASFCVDAIGDVITVSVEDIDAPPANVGAVDGKYLAGVVKLDNGLMNILSISKLLGEEVEQ